MKSKLKEALKEGMKQRDQIRVDTIRSILAAFQYEEMQKQVDELPPEVALQVVQRELKKRHEEIEFAEKANRSEAIEQVKKEISVIETFLPKQLTEGELQGIIEKWKGENAGMNVGIAMKQLKDQYAGQYDGKIASDVVRRVLS